MSNIFIKPATIEIEGEAVIAFVRDPETGIPLAHEGEWKSRSQYWTRRIRDHDVVETNPDVGTVLAGGDAPSAPVAQAPAPFAPCGNCATPEACVNAARCVKAPLG